MKKKISCLLILATVLFGLPGITVYGKKKTKAPAKTPVSAINASLVSGLRFRSVGPAISSGRIADIAVNPKDHKEYFVGTASGGLWKTTNNGTTFTPVFDHEKVYSIGALAIDPENPFVIWAGTGENNSQRNLAYGNGVYKSTNGGKTWKNMGLKKSLHIGKIMIDPRNTNVVYVCAQGPVWGPGGERGLYKTTDGGKTWKVMLSVSENTGITDMEMDPRNPDILYAAAHQRRRRVYTKIDGGPESALYKSEDAGKSWRKLTHGLPGGDVGRIGLTISPVNPDVLYATIELPNNKGGFYRSNDRGESWQKQSSYIATSPQYYQEIYADLTDVNRIYAMDTRAMVSVDGGKTWKPLGEKNKHVDNHALWIDPSDPVHLIEGCDGGIYESWDRGATWIFRNNLPITQFYHVRVDDAEPFYNLYGGAQDNGCWTGPSRTLHTYTVNADWIPTNGGDGYVSMAEPGNPDILYAESQYGGMVRYDRKSGQRLFIQPQPEKDEAYRWNWNTPFLISPHNKTTLYCAANKVFKSTDRGNSWKEISPDLTRRIDVNKLPVMNRIWGPDAIAKSVSTSPFGNIFSLAESPLQPGLIYAGTDDGLIQVTEDDGQHWTKYDHFPGVPDTTFVTYLLPSIHDINTVFAAFDGRKNNDFKPYLLKSTDKGKTWISISSDLPENGTVYVIQEDHVNPALLFAGTEFGVFFTNDAGKHWIQLRSGIPTIAMKDMTLQRRENDLVISTFGRGFYILDDYSPLRYLTPDVLDKEAYIFPVKDALSYIPSGSIYGQGELYFRAQNPRPEAVFTYYLKKSYPTLRQIRKKAEAEARKNKKTISYPTRTALLEEDHEVSPYLLFTIRDAKGQIIRRLKNNPSQGINRVSWDLRFAPDEPVSGPNNYASGPRVAPGTYSVSLEKVVRGKKTQIAGPVSFKVILLENTSLPPTAPQVREDFNRQVSLLSATLDATLVTANDLLSQIKAIRQALLNTKAETDDVTGKVDHLEQEVTDVITAINGPRVKTPRAWVTPPTLRRRMGFISRVSYGSLNTPTEAQKIQYRIVSSRIKPLIRKLEDLKQTELKEINKELDHLGAPPTPGRLPKTNI